MAANPEKAKSVEKQAKEILELAKTYNVEKNFFFRTTFDRYMMQIKVLKKLKKSINDTNALVKKEYVKGRENVYNNPAIAEYNRTTDSANKTVVTLMKIVQNYKKDPGSDNEKDPLLEALGINE